MIAFNCNFARKNVNFTGKSSNFPRFYFISQKGGGREMMINDDGTGEEGSKIQEK